MCTNVNHDYGTSTNSVPPLLAVPISGIVKITIKDLRDKIIGETTAKSNGEWLDTFCLDDGTFIIEFSGNFRPIGKGFNANYSRPITSSSVTIATPLGAIPDLTPPPEGIGPSGPQGEAGPQGESGPDGAKGEIGATGEAGTQGEAGPPGDKGDSGKPGAVGSQGVKGDAGTSGSAGPQGVAGPQGAKGLAGSRGAIGDTGASGSSNRVRYMFIADPIATDSFPIGFEENAITIDNIYSETSGGTVSFIIEQRLFGSANESGTSILASSATADEYGDIRTTVDFLYADVPAKSWLVYVASEVSGGPTGIWLAISYTVIN